MTDWFGGKDPVEQMKAGNDLIMPGTPQQAERIIAAAQHDSLSAKVLDENVTRVLEIILQSPTFKGYKFSDKPDLAKDAAISRMAAADGMVLLKNQGNTLPFKQVKKVAVFGNTSYDIIAGGTGSGDVNKAYTISVTQGLTNAGYTADEALQKGYIQYIADAKAKRPKPRGFFDTPKPIDEMTISADIINQKANDADIAIFTIGRNAGEGADRKLENDYYLRDAEKGLINTIAMHFMQKIKKWLLF